MNTLSINSQSKIVSRVSTYNKPSKLVFGSFTFTPVHFIVEATRDTIFVGVNSELVVENSNTEDVHHFARLSKPSFEKLWDNSDDSIYDTL